MKNANNTFLTWLNISAFTFSFADAFEWFLRVVVLLITIVVSYPKFEDTIKKYYQKYFGKKDV